MKILEKYISDSLWLTFISIFLPLFSIASVVFLIKLATYTAVIQLSLWDMAKLFFFIVPELLFFTVPVSFFVAATLTLFKFSNDNEIIVFFALGIHPKFIIKTFFKPALFLSIIMLFNFFVLFPHVKTLSNNFISYKKSEAKFNLSASGFGHKFGDWLLYIGKDNPDKTFSDVILFNKNQEEEEVLIGAKKAEIINEGGILRLKLISGEGYSYSKEKFTQINFNVMFINNTMEAEFEKYQTPFEFWLPENPSPKKRRLLTMDIMLSIFPLLSLFLIASIGVVHARHQKGKVYLFLFLGILIYDTLAIGLNSILSSSTVPIIAISWLVATYIIYKKHIVAKF